MKNIIFLCVVLFTLFLTGIAFCFNVPSHNGFVNDTSGKLSTKQIKNLNKKVQSINEKTSNEIGVLLISSLDGASVEDAAYQTFNTWKVGKANLDNGVLLLISIKDRKMRIETGKGVGGELTDIQSLEIQDHMKPFLRKEDFYGAINLAINEIGSKLESRAGTITATTNNNENNHSRVNTEAPAPAPAPSSTNTQPTSNALPIWILAGGAFSLIVFLFAKANKRKRLTNVKEKTYSAPPTKPISYAPIAVPKYTTPPSISKAVKPTVPQSTPIYHPPAPKKETLNYSPVYVSPTASSKRNVSVEDSYPTISQIEPAISPPTFDSYNSFNSNSGIDFGGGSSGGGGASNDW